MQDTEGVAITINLEPGAAPGRNGRAMQFAIIAYDGTDEGAWDRRVVARDAHIALSDKLVASGNGLFGGAIMNDEGKMIGTIKVVDFPTREEFDDYMATEPYVTEGVWKEVQVTGFRTGPSYRLPSADS